MKPEDSVMVKRKVSRTKYVGLILDDLGPTVANKLRQAASDNRRSVRAQVLEIIEEWARR